MKAFPMFIKTTGRRVVIVGGGEQAAQKARLILKTDAQIVLAAPALDPELAALVDTGRATQDTSPLSKTLFTGAAMVFVATGCPAWDVCAHAIAKAAHTPVNVVDQPELCDITTPSLVDRDPVVIAIGTEGTAPVLARQIKTRIEEQLPQNLGALAAFAGRLRGAVAQHIPRRDRRGFWQWVFAGPPSDLWHRGAEAHAARAIKTAIAQGGTQDSPRGTLCILDPGCGARDLQTLRAVQRLQEADVIVFDRAEDTAILELARRDAERVALHDIQPGTQWRSDLLTTRITNDLSAGHSVVWLTPRTARAQALTSRMTATAEFIPNRPTETARPDRPDRRAS